MNYLMIGFYSLLAIVCMLILTLTAIMVPESMRELEWRTKDFIILGIWILAIAMAGHAFLQYAWLLRKRNIYGTWEYDAMVIAAGLMLLAPTLFTSGSHDIEYIIAGGFILTGGAHLLVRRLTSR